MDIIRVVVAVCIFCTSSYLVIDLFVNSFNLVVLGTAVAGFVLAHYAWPKNNKEYSAWYDILEYMIDIPYRCIALCLRTIGKVVRDSCDIIDPG